MATQTPNMSLRKWDAESDKFNYIELAANFAKIDGHNHTSGQGVQIPTAGIVDGAISTAKIADLSIINEKIANGTLAGTKIAPGTITANHLASGIIPRIVGVSVSSSGAFIGHGASVATQTFPAPHFKVTFTTAFSSPPTVVATHAFDPELTYGISDYIISVGAVTTTDCKVVFGNPTEDADFGTRPFYLLAIGL